jgi:hypothetical protein
MRRWIQIKLILTACLMAALIIICGRSLGQMRQADQSDRDERRLERRVDTLQKAHDDLRLDIERRLTKIETYVTAGAWLITGIGGVLLVQLGQGLFSLIAQYRERTRKGDRT